MSFRITDIRGIPIEGVSVAPPTWSSVPQISNSNGIIRVSERFVILVKDGYLERLVDAETVGESVVLTKESNARSADERASYVGELNERKRELKVAAYY